MRKIGNLLLGMAFIILTGCNSTVSEKRNQINNNQKHSKLEQTVNADTISSQKNQTKELLPTIDTRILDLLKKTETLQVPLIYSFEDKFDIGSIENLVPLSDEILNLLGIDNIKKSKDYNYSDIVWKCSQIELSQKFTTLVFAIYDGAIGQNVLINYTNNFEFIDFEFITYEDYIEGYSSMKSRIKKDEIIRYYSGYEQPNDTTSFKIDEHGLINVVKKEFKPSDDSSVNNKEVLHESLNGFKVLDNILVTEKFKIRIDRLENGNYRYASWSTNQKMSEKPDLIITNGEYFREGTGGNHRFEFRNGAYTYECSIQPLRGSQTPPAALVVYKGNERILYQPAQIVK